MKHLTSLFLLFISALAFSQVKANVSGNIFNLHENADSIRLVHQIPTGYITYAATKVGKDGNFNMPISLENEDYFVLLVNDYPISLVIRNNSDIKIYGDGANIDAFLNIVNSDESSALNEFMRESRIYKHQLDSANAYLAQNPNMVKSIQQSFAPIYQNFEQYKQNFLRENANNASQIGVIPSLNLETEFSTYTSIIENLKKAFGNAPTVAAVEQEYLQRKRELQAKDPFAPGNEAPDFTQNDINGKPMKLSDLRGQIVLLDFWASWCGPCRKENPNVVANYHKYKDKGFTVMGVSLDNKKEPWLGAIERDGLEWPNHVSDLKGWSNEVAKMYGVHSIPFSILLDKEGKIIGTNLRGEGLSYQLEQIFGY